MNKAKIIWYVDMFDRVKVVCDANIATIDDIRAFADSYTDFKARLVIVHDQMEPLSIEDNGLADTKDVAWENLAMSLKGITAGVRGYAKKTDNLVLLAQAKYTKSAFTKDRGTEAIALANQLLDLAQANITSLASYNVTPAKMTAATGYLAQLTTYNPLPLTQRSTDKALRGDLVKQVGGIRTLLTKEMDELVRTLEEDEALFYGEYFAARRIVRTGIRHEENLTEEEAAAKQLEKEAKKLKTETNKQAAITASKTPSTPASSPAAEGQPDTNGASKPDEAPDGGEGEGEGV